MDLLPLFHALALSPTGSFAQLPTPTGFVPAALTAGVRAWRADDGTLLVLLPGQPGAALLERMQVPDTRAGVVEALGLTSPMIEPWTRDQPGVDGRAGKRWNLGGYAPEKATVRVGLGAFHCPRNDRTYAALLIAPPHAPARDDLFATLCGPD